MRRTRKPKIWLIILVVLLTLSVLAAGAVAAVWHFNEYFMVMELNGDEEIVLAYGTEFEDPGAQSSFWGTHLLREKQDVPVTVSGTVDTSKVGTYGLTYTATIRYKDLFWDRERTMECKRTVHVVDGEAPVIELTYVEGYYTLPGQTYVEEGYVAYDGYDGDITDWVTVTMDQDTVTYEVTDSSGNTVSVSRKIFYDDPIAPEIFLNGESQIMLIEGDEFTDPGCSATDNVDGDLTGSIVVGGTVDVNVPGTYTLTYTIADGWGNTAYVQRTVVVEVKPTEPPTEAPTEPPPYVPAEPLPSNGKVIYLTFDDGPGPYTSKLLDILAKYNVKATFFVVNTGYLDILPRIVQEGHSVGVHCYSHDFPTVYASDEAYLADLQRMRDVIYSYTGYWTNILRFPGGSSNTISRWYCSGIMTRMTQKVEEMGMRYFDWNIDSYDAGGATTRYEVYCNVANSIAGSSRQSFVVLQHDLWGFSVNAVEDIIIWGLANGYTFATLDEYSPSCEHGVAN